MQLTLICSAYQIWHIEPIFLFQFKERYPQKISYERRDYESVDDKSLLLPTVGYIPKTYEKRIRAVEG